MVDQHYGLFPLFQRRFPRARVGPSCSPRRVTARSSADSKHYEKHVGKDILEALFVHCIIYYIYKPPGYFSLVVGACGYKADVRTTEGICTNIETLRVVRSDPKKPFYAFVSVKKKYADEDAAAEQADKWNNGDRMSRSSALYTSWVGRRRAVLDKDVEGNHKFIRSYHKLTD
jgi:hypothetical protein